ncbi:MAG TPA: cytochrome c [Chitinophagaceae bacterium]|nr:cytochrome c [Chitinophagaceae bacterium]
MKINLSPFILTITLILFSGIRTSANDVVAGEELFKQLCAACHSIGKGRLVGPDLANIDQRRPQEWIYKFIKSSQSVIKSGDQYADSLFRAYNQIIMPDQPALVETQLNDVLAYITTKRAAPASPTSVVATEQIDRTIVNKQDNLFTQTNLILLGVILFMLCVLWFLSRINKNLSDKLMDYYSSNESFYK